MINEHDYQEAVKSMRGRTSRLEREGDYWTADEKTHLQTMFEAGIGLTEMAILLQRTEPAVIQQVGKMDLYRREACPRRRRSVPKAPRCLCTACGLDPGFCPRSGAGQEVA